MKLTIVYDNEIFKKGFGLRSDWGFSCLIETKNENILFDTGAKGKILLNNMEKLGIDPSNIKKIIISHEHWDHDGGLKRLVPLVDDLEVYRLENELSQKNMVIKIVDNAQKISDGIYTTGRLKGDPVDEQSLVIKGEKGCYVLTGCSHSGVGQIFNAARQFGDIVGLIGGLHGFNDFSFLDDLDIICPCHCTKYKQQIKNIYQTKLIEGGVGQVISII